MNKVARLTNIQWGQIEMDLPVFCIETRVGLWPEKAERDCFMDLQQPLSYPGICFSCTYAAYLLPGGVDSKLFLTEWPKGETQKVSSQ